MGTNVFWGHPWKTTLAPVGQRFPLGPSFEYTLVDSPYISCASNSLEPQKWPRDLRNWPEIFHPKQKEKNKRARKGKKKKTNTTHLTELVLTVVIDGVGNQRRKSYGVVAVLVGEEGLEAEADDVEIVLVDVVQLFFGHWTAEGKTQLKSPKPAVIPQQTGDESPPVEVTNKFLARSKWYRNLLTLCLHQTRRNCPRSPAVSCVSFPRLAFQTGFMHLRFKSHALDTLLSHLCMIKFTKWMPLPKQYE